jgi:acetylglutamate kinase
MKKISIIKISGNVIENKSELSKFLTLFANLKGPKILVHGGGKMATEISHRLGIESKLIGGRRITDAKTLEVITMVYAGLTNKNIVAELQANNCNAIGLSGADANVIQAHKRPVGTIDYGFAGDIDGINSSMISKLFDAGLTPVFCAMTHDGNGQLLNTNADTIASELAIGLSGLYETTLYYCFEKKGVLQDVEDDNSVLKHIDSKKYQELLKDGIIANGMLPKLENCFHALNNEVKMVCLGDITMITDENTPETPSRGPSMYTTITL